MSLEKSLKLFRSKAGNAMAGFEKLAVGVASFAIAVVVGFLIMAQAKAQVVSVQGINVTDGAQYTLAYNATNTMIGAVATLPAWVGIVIVTTIGGILIGLVSLFRNRAQ